MGGSRYHHTTLTAGKENWKASYRPSDISDHLGAIFFFAVDAEPGLIVELGTRGGESTQALLAAANVNAGHVLSIDIDQCQPRELSFQEKWSFVQADDVNFGRSHFTDWCSENNREPKITLLFIDTSHEYEHTKAEFEAWISFLAEQGTIILHDTNMGNGVYGRTDGSAGIGWNNQRGVIRAVEELIERPLDENQFIHDITPRFLLMHYPNCNGLTILKSRPGPST